VTSQRADGDPGSVRPGVALALATVSFVALLIVGLGMLSLGMDEDVIATRGLGLAPGVAATTLATLAFAAGLWAGVRMTRPSYGAAGWCAVASFLGYLAGVWFGALLGGAGLATAVGAAGGVATSWFGVVVAVVGLVCGWGGIALVRTRARRPRWPWEDDADE
jgi:hypothetical protein